MYRNFCRALSGVWLAHLLAAPPLLAQAGAAATVTGVVLDPTNSLVVAATVSLRNHDTNQTLETRTDSRGQYRLVSVPPGDYHLSATAEGFVTANVDLTLTVGQAIDVPVRLPAAAVSDALSVVAAAPLVDAVRTQVAGTITPHEVDRLPLNGRNYLDLALLLPNVSRTNTRSNERFAETSAVPGTGISVAGQRNIGNTFIVDGLSANDDAADLAGSYFGEEVIREFQVITSGGSAEFGRSSAGVINIVTQSGTNQPRGRGYGFFRHHALDARNALASREEPLSHAQYGLTLSGPLARNRTFWFANVERTDLSKSGVVTIGTGTAAVINDVLDARGHQGPRVRSGEFPTGYDTLNAFGRVDHQLSQGSQLEVRYSFYDVASQNARAVGGLNDVSRGARLDNRDQTLASRWLQPWGSRLLNELRAQATRSRLAAPANDPIGPAISISGVANLGNSSSSPTGRTIDLVQVADTVTFQQGAHLTKAGVDFLYNDVTIVFPGAARGSYDFTSLANFNAGAYRQYQQAFGRDAVSQSNPNLGLFVQDEWRAAPAITVNAGLRYDLQFLPAPIALDTNNLSPRLGVAWSPDSSTVVRASAGLYFDRIPLRATSNALQRDGIDYRIAVISSAEPGAPVFPHTLSSFPSTLLTAISTIDPQIQNGRSAQFALQLERGVARTATITAGYSYLRGRHIIMQRNVNAPTLTPAQAAAAGIPNLGRPNPAFGNIGRYESIGDAWFHGFTASIETRPAWWGTARASYTLSRAEDTGGNAFFSAPQDNGNVAAERGPSDNDQTHRLVISGTIGSAGEAGAGGWWRGVQLGYVVSFATGVPFNVVAGSDLNNDTTNNDRPRGVSRNSARQPSTATVDVRVSRRFVTGRRHRLEALIEAFNIFNRTNILAVNNTFGTGTVPLASFGQPTLAGDPRQIQAGIRWTF
jgi:hypothetical protein